MLSNAMTMKNMQKSKKKTYVRCTQQQAIVREAKNHTSG